MGTGRIAEKRRRDTLLDRIEPGLEPVESF